MNPLYPIFLLNSILSNAINVQYLGTEQNRSTLTNFNGTTDREISLRNQNLSHTIFNNPNNKLSLYAPRFRRSQFLHSPFGKAEKKPLKLAITDSRSARLLSPAAHDKHPIVRTYQVEYFTASVSGLRVEVVEKGVAYGHYGISEILADVPVTIRLFGKNFTNHTVVRFVTELKGRGTDCDDTSSTKYYPISDISLNHESAKVQVVLPASQADEFYYVCVRENDEDMPWIHQGPDRWLMIRADPRLLPFWIQGILICLLLLLSGLFAGLTLGLLSLDTTSLKILSNTGEEKQRNYARTILPLRSRGNYLLCSLVLGNVLINSTLTIILDDLTSGLLAVTISTAGIVIIGEIIPQAVCSRNGLAIGAKTVWVTKFIMLITFPLSFTISYILDKVLGEEIGIVYTREKLKELIKVAENDLEVDEVNTIRGALDLKLKNVEEIMTRLDDIFMLPLEAVLDFELLTEIRRQGYSRIPIYERERQNIVALLMTKDLIFVDPDDKINLKTLAQYYNNPCFWIHADAKLDRVFKSFRECQKGHMGFVQRLVCQEADKDPYWETIGLVTLEDIIEEIIQAEIVDEDDLWMDNRSKKKMLHHQKQDFSKFFEIRNSQKSICISPQLALAAFQFLTTVVEPFQTDFISEEVLHQVLKKHVIFKIKKDKDTNDETFLYEKGKLTDCFTLIVEGRVEVTAGKENLKFETGAFTYFGVPALLSSAGEMSFIPDYGVKPVTDVVILRVRRPLYLAALQATVLERARPFKDHNASDMNIDDQIENILKSVDSESFDPLNASQVDSSNLLSI